MANIVDKAVKQVETAATDPVEEKTEITSPKKDVIVESDVVDKESAVANEEAAAKENVSSKVNGADIVKKIIHQVEYYFGNANLNRDKFLLAHIAKDEDGWVPISVLLTFKRLAALSTDSNVIVDALMKSHNDLVEISEDKLKLRRNPNKPLPERNEERRKDILSRTAYLKGFPLDLDIDSLLEYFDAFVKVSHINMRKYLDRPTNTHKFKGSVFVTFETKEHAENFIEKEKHEYKNSPLVCKWQEKYLEEKREEHITKNNQKKVKKPKGNTEYTLAKRSVLYFEGANEHVTREDIRQAVSKISSDFDIAYIEFSKGEKVGHIRFKEEDTAEKFLAMLENKKLLVRDDVPLDVRTLGEEEEEAYLSKALENLVNRRAIHGKKYRRGNHTRKRRGGSGDRQNDKKTKVDA